MSTEKLLALYPFDPPPPRRTYPSPHGPLTSAHPHASENIRFAFGIIQIFIWSMCPLVRVCVFVPNILVVAECDLKRFLYFWLSLWVINLWKQTKFVFHRADKGNLIETGLIQLLCGPFLWRWKSARIECLNQIWKAIKSKWKRLANILRYVTKIYDSFQAIANLIKKIINVVQSAYESFTKVNSNHFISE